MIKGLMGNQGVTVSGGNTSLPYISSNANNPIQGMIRINNTDLDVQKQHMRNIADKAGSSKIGHLEGTCIDADVKTKTRTEIDS